MTSTIVNNGDSYATVRSKINQGDSIPRLIGYGAIDRGLNTPPASPAEGDVYIVGTSPTGGWAGQPNKIAVRYNSAWIFEPSVDLTGSPVAIGPTHEGLTIYVRDEDRNYYWDGTAWRTEAMRILAEWRNILEYGATIVDTTDTGVIAANTAAFAAANSAGVDVYIPQGPLVTGAIIMTAARQRVQQHAQSVIKHRPGAALNLISMRGAWQSWEGGQIDGNFPNVTYSYNSSEVIFEAPDCSIRKVQLRACQSMGIRVIRGAPRWTWEDIEVDGAGDFGLFCNDAGGSGADPGSGYANRIRVRNFGRSGNTAVAIGVRAQTSCHVTNFTVEQTVNYGSDQLGVEFWTGSDGHDVSFGTVYGNGFLEFGISATGKRNRVSNIDVYNIKDYPFELMDISSQVDTCRAFGSDNGGFSLNMNPLAGSLIGDRTTFSNCHATGILGTTAGSAAFVVDGIPGQIAEGVDFADCLAEGPAELLRLVFVSGASASNFRGYQSSGNRTPISLIGDHIDLTNSRLLITSDTNPSVIAVNISGSFIRVRGSKFDLSNDASNGMVVQSGSTEIDIEDNKVTGLSSGHALLSQATGPTIRVKDNYSSAAGWTPTTGNVFERNQIGTLAPVTNQPVPLPSFTVATAPAAAAWVGASIYVSNESGGAVVCFSDGTNWRRVTDRAIMS